MNNRYFYCYSVGLKNYFCDNGLRYITRGIHDATKKTFWVFDSTERISTLLEQWRMNRPAK